MIWLNQAATTFPKPRCVLDAHTAALSAPPEGQFRSNAARNGDAFDRCRENLGKLLGISAVDHIYFTSGATDAANALISGLPLTGKRVLATQTEHNSVLRPLMNLTDRVGGVDIVPCDALGRVDPAAAARMLSEPAAALFVNHCSNVTGMVQDIPTLAEIAHRCGTLLVLDASQSAGCLPVDADAWGVDALIFTGHKALFGPQGTGGYYVRPGVPLRPFRYGGTGRNSRRLTYEYGDYEYEVGTQDAPGIAALNAGIEYVLERGVNAIHDNERGMMKALFEGLAAIPGVMLYGDYARCRGPLISFNIRELTPSDVAYILSGSYGITVRAGLHCSPLIHDAMGTSENGTVRVSVSDMNTKADIEALIAAVREISASVEAAT
ncbi:MAG: aminotransferase class V-fold PLP-dependent enzyme [Clostridia bacterium]|nr:aminotransferase class V-fold PLP-dependent enzyme [Clostridia bacterium]